jgi:hypothetical protein
MIAIALGTPAGISAQSAPDDPPAGSPVSGAPALPGDLSAKETQVHWGDLVLQSLEFLTIEHVFRLSTEAATLNPHISTWRGYVDSVTNLHGWADGDPFLVNYVGHPMQGSVSGFLWIQNDPKYRDVEFGKNRRYWKSRLRAAAFAWAYSELFEIGPASEASIGAIQAFFPQQGFVDHIITPTVGLGWILAEDFMDKYVIQRWDHPGIYPWVRMLLRGGLNPSRSFANTMGGHVPWYRYTRPDVYEDSRGPTISSRRRRPRFSIRSRGQTNATPSPRSRRSSYR